MNFQLVAHPFYCTGAAKTHDSEPKLSSQRRFGQSDAHFLCTGAVKTNFLHRRGGFEQSWKFIAPAVENAPPLKLIKTDGNLSILIEKIGQLRAESPLFFNSRAAGRRTTEKHFSGISRALLGHLSGISRAPLGHLSGTSRAPLGHLSGTSRAPPGHLPGISRALPSSPGRVTRIRALLRQRI